MGEMRVPGSKEAKWLVTTEIRGERLQEDQAGPRATPTGLDLRPFA